MFFNNTTSNNDNDMYLYGSTTNQYYYDPPVDTPYLDTCSSDAAFSPSYGTAPPAASSPEDTPATCHLAFNPIYSPVFDGPTCVASLNEISNMLSKGDPYEWPDNIFDPVFQFDGNPSRLVIPPQTEICSEEGKCATPAIDYSSLWQPQVPIKKEQDVQEEEEEEEQLFPPLPEPPKRRRVVVDDDDEYVPAPSKPAKRRAAVVTSSKKNVVENQSRPYECPICHARFNRSYNLRTHKLTHDKNRPKPFACHLCDKGFARKHDRDRHVSAVHAGERLFECDLCQASFARRTYLTSHIATAHPYR
ncbi:hypothetical protein BJV82DRAFT_585111 [Fennellomyces sp. T-0311]|nr:hypothetical protein BJV82DRAFT_585111 [Fennellomyces sp. T-0311]